MPCRLRPAFLQGAAFSKLKSTRGTGDIKNDIKKEQEETMVFLSITVTSLCIMHHASLVHWCHGPLYTALLSRTYCQHARSPSSIFCAAASGTPHTLTRFSAVNALRGRCL